MKATKILFTPTQSKKKSSFPWWRGFLCVTSLHRNTILFSDYTSNTITKTAQLRNIGSTKSCKDIQRCSERLICILYADARCTDDVIGKWDVCVNSWVGYVVVHGVRMIFNQFQSLLCRTVSRITHGDGSLKVYLLIVHYAITSKWFNHPVVN